MTRRVARLSSISQGICSRWSDSSTTLPAWWCQFGAGAQRHAHRRGGQSGGVVDAVADDAGRRGAARLAHGRDLLIRLAGGQNLIDAELAAQFGGNVGLIARQQDRLYARGAQPTDNSRRARPWLIGQGDPPAHPAVPSDKDGRSPGRQSGGGGGNGEGAMPRSARYAMLPA